MTTTGFWNLHPRPVSLNVFPSLFKFKCSELAYSKWASSKQRWWSRWSKLCLEAGSISAVHNRHNREVVLLIPKVGCSLAATHVQALHQHIRMWICPIVWPQCGRKGKLSGWHKNPSPWDSHFLRGLERSCRQLGCWIMANAQRPWLRHEKCWVRCVVWPIHWYHLFKKSTQTLITSVTVKTFWFLLDQGWFWLDYADVKHD